MRQIKCMLFVLVGLISVCDARFPLVTMKSSASAADDQKAKLFEADPVRALAYVYRDNAFIGKNAKSKIVVNNNAVAENEGNHFVVLSLAPGTYDLMSLTSGEKNALVSFTHNKNKTSVQLTAEAGKIYYFQEVFSPKSGFSMKPMSADEAQPMIKKGKLGALYKL